MISVIQPGARLHYAVPEIFARAGLLRTLYTDLHAEHAWLRALDRALTTVVPRERQPGSLRRLLDRRLPNGLPRESVDDLPIETLLRHGADQLGLTSIGSRALPARIMDRLEHSHPRTGQHRLFGSGQ